MSLEVIYGVFCGISSKDMPATFNFFFIFIGVRDVAKSISKISFLEIKFLTQPPTNKHTISSSPAFKISYNFFTVYVKLVKIKTI